jgi:hypothetical protein
MSLNAVISDTSFYWHHYNEDTKALSNILSEKQII